MVAVQYIVNQGQVTGTEDQGLVTPNMLFRESHLILCALEPSPLHWAPGIHSCCAWPGLWNPGLELGTCHTPPGR